VEHARLLLEQGADPEVRARSDKSYTALHMAVARGHVAMVAFLIEECCSMAVNEESRADWTPLHTAADGGSAEMVSLLLSNGADHSAMVHVSRPETPLGVAVAAGNLEVVKLLVAAGTDLDKGWQSPLHIAASKGDAECCRVLVQMGRADVNKLDCTCLSPVQIAAGLDDEETALSVVRELLRGQEKAEICRGTTKMQVAAVVRAAQRGHATVLREMMERDIDAAEVYRRAVVDGEVRAVRDGVFLRKGTKGWKEEQEGKWCDYTPMVSLKEQYVWQHGGYWQKEGTGYYVRLSLETSCEFSLADNI
jgi:hypothetical protein